MKALQFHELEQPNFTHVNGLARSKLDRVYTNHEVHDQLDRNYECYTMPYVSCSDHKAVNFSRTTSSTTGRRDSSIMTKATYKHKDFRRQAILEYGQLLQEDLLESTVPRRLILFKRAMRNAAKCIGKDIEANVAASA